MRLGYGSQQVSQRLIAPASMRPRRMRLGYQIQGLPEDAEAAIALQ